MVTDKDRCKFCGKLLIEQPEGCIGGKDNPIVVLRDGKLAHEDCARDYYIIKSRENHICD
jgi:hypothetical protein